MTGTWDKAKCAYELRRMVEMAMLLDARFHNLIINAAPSIRLCIDKLEALDLANGSFMLSATEFSDKLHAEADATAESLQ